MWPATILQHPYVTVLLDEAASGRLHLPGHHREADRGTPPGWGIGR